MSYAFETIYYADSVFLTVGIGMMSIVQLDNDRAVRGDTHRIDLRIATGEVDTLGESLETALSSTIRETVEATLCMSPR